MRARRLTGIDEEAIEAIDKFAAKSVLQGTPKQPPSGVDPLGAATPSGSEYAAAAFVRSTCPLLNGGTDGGHRNSARARTVILKERVLHVPPDEFVAVGVPTVQSTHLVLMESVEADWGRSG
ncbi:hypothetical protein Daesc_000336 [Daldinia eschscholtzii]|uniref:Uncharacterized protein n=1 Tax=Daldinia eschscholtzii TaxID=292717 RepID=A0AAX6MY62_9PEZI